MPELDTPHVKVTMTDGREFDVQTENPDMVAFDLERGKRKWPGIQEAPFLWLNFLAYSKLRRTGALAANGAGIPSFEAWVGQTSRVTNVDAAGDESAETERAFPTNPDHESG